MNTKKLAALLLAVVMVVALCACGQSSAPAASTDSAAKVGQTVLKVAFNQTITNPEAQLGDQAQTLEQVVLGTLDMALVILR